MNKGHVLKIDMITLMETSNPEHKHQHQHQRQHQHACMMETQQQCLCQVMEFGLLPAIEAYYICKFGADVIYTRPGPGSLSFRCV